MELLTTAAGVLLAVLIIVVIVMTLVVGFFAIALIYPEPFKNDPNNLKWYQFVVKMAKNRSGVVVRGGRPMYVIRGIDKDPVRYHTWPLWVWYQELMFKTWKLQVHVPYFEQMEIRKLPRRRRVIESGVTLIEDVEPDNTNHVRIGPTTWPIEVAGTFTDGVRINVKAGVVYQIRTGEVPGKINENTGLPLQQEMVALFTIDAWNEVLDQASIATIRKLMASKAVRLQMIVGQAEKELWTDLPSVTDDDSVDEDNPYYIISRLIKKQLDKWHLKVDGEDCTLYDLAIDIQRVDIYDFEVNDPELERELAAAAIGQKAGQGAALRGQGQAAAQEALLDVYRKVPEEVREVMREMIRSQAFEQGLKGTDPLSALLAAVTQNQQKGGS